MKENFDAFPYVLNPDKRGTVHTYKQESGLREPVVFYPTHPPCANPKPPNTYNPSYVLMLPTTGKVDSLLNIIKEQSFGTQPSDSLTPISERVACVVGMNRPVSLDGEKNRAFYSSVAEYKKIDGIAYRVFGFFWKPVWKCKECAPTHPYPVEKGYQLLKALSRDAAIQILNQVETGVSYRPQVPYTEIRETILRSANTRAFVDFFTDKAPNSPVYMGTMDADLKSLRVNNGIGSLTHFDEAIIDHAMVNGDYPFAITSGYVMRDPKVPIIEEAVKLDMRVRSAMNSALEGSAYFPEPWSFFCVQEPDDPSHLFSFSFLGSTKTLENRKLIVRARNLSCLDNKRMLFLSEPTIEIAPKPEMYTGTSCSVQIVDVRLRKVLKPLRSLSQSHAFPRNWAQQIYAALDFKTSSWTDATEIFTRIFGVFDPITRMYAAPERFSRKVFDKVINTYGACLTAAQQSTLWNTRMDLYNLGMNATDVERVIDAAKASGEAIYDYLKTAAS